MDADAIIDRISAIRSKKQLIEQQYLAVLRREEAQLVQLQRQAEEQQIGAERQGVAAPSQEPLPPAASTVQRQQLTQLLLSKARAQS